MMHSKKRLITYFRSRQKKANLEEYMVTSIAPTIAQVLQNVYSRIRRYKIEKSLNWLPELST